MIDYPLEPGQRMLVKSNSFGPFAEHAHRLVVLNTVISTDKGIIAKGCSYVDEDQKIHTIDIPLFLLWRIADDEDLLEMHENYINSNNL